MMVAMVKNNSHVVRKPTGSQTTPKPSGRADRPTQQMDARAQEALAADTRAQPAAAPDDSMELEIQIDDAPPPEAKSRRTAHTVARRPK